MDQIAHPWKGQPAFELPGAAPKFLVVGYFEISTRLGRPPALWHTVTMTSSDLLRGILAGTVALSLVANISCVGRQHSSPPVAAAPSLPEMIEHVRGSIVGIIVELDRRQLQHPPVPSSITCFNEGKCVVGTGFFVNDKADVVTASHVADGVTSLLQQLAASNIAARALLEIDMPNFENKAIGRAQVTMLRGHKLFGFRIQDEDRAHDIAILSPTMPNLFEQARRPVISAETTEKTTEHEPTNSPSAVTFDITRPREGEDVFACGYPLGAADVTTTSGHLATVWESEVPRHARELGLSGSVDVYRLDLTATFGNSGGPAFLAKDQGVIGMIIEGNGVPGGGGWTATAIPSHYITEMLDKNHIVWNSSVGRQ
jgi:S1-C subfamily serine protease